MLTTMKKKVSLEFKGKKLTTLLDVKRENEEVRMDRTCFSLLAYADDIVLLGEEEQKVVDLCVRLIESAKKVGLYLNVEKTQYMKVSRELDNFPETKTITAGQYEFKIVKDFKYLGKIVTQKIERQIEIQQRIKMGNECIEMH
ncbi:hypothetical protein QTP88_010815 [Uroleucon formosanum]